MNLRQLELFITVAEMGNVTRAAERLGMRQPPLSQALKRLERDVGVRLLERTAVGVVLTDAGKLFFAEAREAVAAATRATALARAAANRKKAVRVGVVSLALFERLPTVLKAARKLKIAVDVSYASTNEQLEALAKGQLDFGFLSPPFDAPKRMKVKLLEEQPLVVALPVAMASASESVSLGAVHQELMLFPRADGPALHDAIVDLFRIAGLPLTQRQETPASMLAALAMVASGIGATLVPAAIARSISVEGLVFRALESAHPVPSWPLALAHMPLATRGVPARLLEEVERRFARG